MLIIEAIWIDDEVLDKIEGKHGLKYQDVEEALMSSDERCFRRVGGDQIKAYLKDVGWAACGCIFNTYR